MKLSSMLFTIALSLGAVGCTQDKTISSDPQVFFDMNQGQRFGPDESKFNFFLFLRPEDDYVTRRSTVEKNVGWEKIAWGTSDVEIIYNDNGPLPVATATRINNGGEFAYFAKLNRIPPSSFIELKSLVPNTTGWIAQNKNCTTGYFSKHLKTLSTDVNTYTNVAVRISACTRLTASAAQIASSFGLLTNDETRTLKKLYVAKGKINQRPGFPYGRPEISGTWGNVTPKFKTTGIRNAVTQITFSFESEANQTVCNGNIISFETLSSGNWEIECSNGDYAKGTWVTVEKSKLFLATGQDKKQQTVKFKILY